MNELFDVYNRHSLPRGLKIEIYHSNIVDWRITIEHSATKTIIVDIQHCDYELVFAKAQVELKEWLLENNGGY